MPKPEDMRVRGECDRRGMIERGSKFSAEVGGDPGKILAASRGAVRATVDAALGRRGGGCFGMRCGDRGGSRELATPLLAEQSRKDLRAIAIPPGVLTTGNTGGYEQCGPEPYTLHPNSSPYNLNSETLYILHLKP